jgi:adenylyltransferase/sulfurtransferase
LSELIFERYQKQLLFKPIGLKGQQRLNKSQVGILGIGALGSNLASICARSGVGKLVLVDSDRVELSNLQRQMLFDEADVGLGKAICAADKLSRINSEISIEAFSERLDARNFRDLFGSCDLLLDGTDNFASRFVLNQQAIASGIPWIHSAVTAASGQ